METTTTTTTSLEEEAQAGTEVDRDTFLSLVARLNRQSVDKHFDAYADVPWDDPAFALDPTDPRWELSADEPLGGTEWYRSQPQPIRARIGLHSIADKMKVGLQFEGVLKRGLLEWAADLPNHSPEFRYAYHEVIEEAHHSLMFQEFVNRSGVDVPGLPWHMRFGSRRVVALGRRFPALFFVFVLGGEDPVDHVQRRMLRSDRDLHPLLERIMRIHVTEEARHLSFARHYLKTTVPSLGLVRRTWLSVQAPLILGQMAAQMLRPSKGLVRTYGVPKRVVAEAYGSAEARASVNESLRKVRTLLDELGLITPLTRPIWRALKIWPASN